MWGFESPLGHFFIHNMNKKINLNENNLFEFSKLQLDQELPDSLEQEELLDKKKRETVDARNQADTIIHTTEIIGMNDRSTRIFKEKPDSSLVKSIQLVRDGEAHAGHLCVTVILEKPRHVVAGLQHGIEHERSIGETLPRRLGAVHVGPGRRRGRPGDHVRPIDADPVLGIAWAIAECNDNLLFFDVVSIIGADFLRERSRCLYGQNAGYEEALGLQYFLHHLVGLIMSGRDMNPPSLRGPRSSSRDIKAEMAFFGRKKASEASQRSKWVSKRVQAIDAWASLFKPCKVEEVTINLSKHVQASGSRLGWNRRGGR